jgi:hypothetical protein
MTVRLRRQRFGVIQKGILAGMAGFFRPHETSWMTAVYDMKDIALCIYTVS